METQYISANDFKRQMEDLQVRRYYSIKQERRNRWENVLSSLMREFDLTLESLAFWLQIPEKELLEINEGKGKNAIRNELRIKLLKHFKVDIRYLKGESENIYFETKKEYQSYINELIDKSLPWMLVKMSEEIANVETYSNGVRHVSTATKYPNMTSFKDSKLKEYGYYDWS